MNNSIPRDERLLVSALLYAEDAAVDVDVVAARLMELAGGDEDALGQAHKRAGLLIGRKSGDAVTRRALEIVRRALERTGSC